MEKIIQTPNVSLVTVTFTGDKWLMLLQAHSIEKFVKEPTTHYVIIENSAGTSTLEWLCLLQPIYKKHKLVLLDKVSAPELFLEWDKGTISGWDQQQYIKLKIHSLISTEYYLSLDSKNFFIRPTSLLEFYGTEGCDTVMHTNSDPVHESLPYWYNWMLTIEEHTCRNRPESFWFAGTPFNLKTDIVKEIFEHDIDTMFKHALDARHFNLHVPEKDIRISEYILYAYFSSAPRKEELSWTHGYDESLKENLFADRTNDLSRPVFTLQRDRTNRVRHQQGVIDYLMFCELDSSYVVPGVILGREWHYLCHGEPEDSGTVVFTVSHLMSEEKVS